MRCLTAVFYIIFEFTFYIKCKILHLVYIHLLPENIIKNAGIDWNHFNSLYPEVLNEET